MDLKNLPKEEQQREKLKQQFPTLNKKGRKIIKAIIKGMLRTKQISQEKYDETMMELEKLEKK